MATIRDPASGMPEGSQRSSAQDSDRKGRGKPCFAEPKLLDQALGQEIRVGAGRDGGVEGPVGCDVLGKRGRAFRQA